jgi:hypothetical protein
MKAYLDNVIVSAMAGGDFDDPAEMAAVRKLEAANGLVTSRETWREQDRTSDPVLRAQLQQARDKLELVREDHLMLGTRPQYDRSGNWYGNSPMLTEIVDEALFAKLKAAGLKDADARHFMYAVHNGIDRFITTDPHFINRRTQLEELGRGIRIQKPSELVAELGL